MSRLIVGDAVTATDHDATTIDLLIRPDQAPDHRPRAVELSRQLLMSPSHISRMIDRAEEALLVERKPDPGDRRATQITLTAFSPHLDAIIERVIHQTLTPSGAETLVELLARVEQAAARRVQ
ncbi:MAG: MarR family transcriptional regulator [Actinomycetota bacterium]|nr:MarR family transcriptional regulator [Actinomycetota bacterium]